MLGLKLPTDSRWAKIAEKNISEILTDHAYAEQKAASTAISLIIGFPEHTELVSKMSELVQEEMAHFTMVHNHIIKRGYILGKERMDEYVGDLRNFMHKGGSRETQLMERLLVAGLIEARSCERFRLLSEQLEDEELAIFYKDLMASEARHYTMFLSLAKQYCGEEKVLKRWDEYLEYEAKIIRNYGKKEEIHG